MNVLASKAEIEPAQGVARLGRFAQHWRSLSFSEAAVNQIGYVRLFADEQGSSHIDKGMALHLEAKNFVPPAPAIGVSPLQPASTCAFLSVPAAYSGDWHPSPARQWLVFISGQMEFESSDGERFVGRTGTVVLLEDTTGIGHRSTVGSEEPATMIAVQLQTPARKG